MTLTEIKEAVLEGMTVHWKHEGYVVVESGSRAVGEANQWLIMCVRNEYCIGLTHMDGVTMNGKAEDFFVGYMEKMNQIQLGMYLGALRAGERVIETTTLMFSSGWTGTVYLNDKGWSCVMWDEPGHPERKMGTSPTGGTRRITDVLSVFQQAEG